MEKITSFTIDHLRLVPGVYVSRIDHVEGHPVTTFDLRMTSPNDEPVMNTAEVHTIEHLAATFLRNHEEYADRTIYFGPMGCRTGFYLILSGEYQSRDILPLMKEMYTFIACLLYTSPGYSVPKFLHIWNAPALLLPVRQLQLILQRQPGVYRSLIVLDDRF